MGAHRGISIGLGAVLVASAGLGAFGLRSSWLEAERVRSKLVADAHEAVALVASSFERQLDALALGELEGNVELELLDDGTLRPLLGERSADELRSPRDPGLHAFLEAEVDRLEREGELDGARDRLRAAAAQDDPWISAWATTALAALARRAGDAEGERAALTKLAALPIGVRDARGLSRALAARHALVELDGASFDERLALYTALVQDQRTLHETATAELAARVRAELAPTDASAAVALSEALDIDARRARLRALGASDAGAFLFGARPGERRVVTAPADPLRAGARAVEWVVARAEGDAPRAYALELDALCAATLARPEVAAFARGGLALSIAPRAHADAEPALAARPLPLAGARELELRAAALDFDALVAAERRRFASTAVLTGGALLVALLAAVATARAVAREGRLVREREAFVAVVSHELRTPLAATRLLAELLARGGVEEEKVVEFARRIGVESERLSRLVASIQDLARLERGAAGAPRERVDLRALASAAVERFEPLARDEGFTVVLRAGDEALLVEAERDALIGALLNLLDNARKHAEAPHAIEVELERRARTACVRVLDRGRGIPEAERERVFEAFARVGDVDTRDRPGAGLGLALVKRVVVAHGGTVVCHARTGGGSEFALELPLKPEGEAE